VPGHYLPMTSEGSACADIVFQAFARDKRVEVTCGLPPRPRSLELFVAGGEYDWGRVCYQSMELARAMLLFCWEHGKSCDSCMSRIARSVYGRDPNQVCTSFAVDVLAWRAANEDWTMTMKEVLVWLAK
jgi:hypothetical protein